tara:strand:- start:23766 stop:25100 length:1335 start_codon:yes stop_codon:yes gene_type:complete
LSNKNLSLKKGLLSRNAAWDVLRAVSAGAYADVALDRAIKKYSLIELDRSLATELAYGSIRYRYLLDSWIDYLAKVPAIKQPPLLRWLLHLGLYQILYMQRIPVSAAINTTVELAKGSQLNKLTSVVNGFLRSVSRHLIEGKFPPVPLKTSKRISLQNSLPDWLVEELMNIFAEKEVEEIAKASNKIPVFDLRVNRLKTSPEIILKQFKKVGIGVDIIDDFPDALQLKAGLGDLRKWPGYELGHWCIQDRSSQWVAPLLDPQQGDRVLDACSAPGTKATHIAELIANKGEVWAVDRSPSRLKLVSENAARLGAESIKVLAADSRKLLDIKPEWKGFFQRILVDAPCSGLGTLARNPDARWRMTPRKIEDLVTLQRQLLEGVLPLLSPGGRIVYSTCTIHPDENYRQVEEFARDNLRVRLKYQQQILPNIGKSGDGFYAAIFEKD